MYLFYKLTVNSVALSPPPQPMWMCGIQVCDCNCVITVLWFVNWSQDNVHSFEKFNKLSCIKLYKCFQGEIRPDLTLKEGHDPPTVLEEGETTLPLRVHSDTVSGVVEHIHVMYVKWFVIVHRPVDLFQLHLWRLQNFTMNSRGTINENNNLVMSSAHHWPVAKLTHTVGTTLRYIHLLLVLWYHWVHTTTVVPVLWG